MSNETISLHTCNTDGTGGEAKLYHMAQFDAEHHALGSPPPLTATSSQNNYVRAFITGTDVDIRAIAKAPTNITSATITIVDGRTVAGLPVQYVITVNVVQNPDLSSIEVTTSDAVRAL